MYKFNIIMLLIGCHALSIPLLSLSNPIPSLPPTLSFQSTPLPPTLSFQPPSLPLSLSKPPPSLPNSLYPAYFLLPVVALLSTSISVSSSLISMLWHFSEPLSGFRPNCFKLADGSPLQKREKHINCLQ